MEPGDLRCGGGGGQPPELMLAQLRCAARDVQLGITGAQDELGQTGQVPPSVSLNSLANNSTESALPNALAVCQLWFPIIVPPSWLMVRGTP